MGNNLHTINGIRSWSTFRYTINVSKIQNITYRKRLFCIFDYEHKYELTIKYHEPKTKYILLYGITYNYKSEYEYIVARYENIESINKELNAINTKIQSINNLRIS